jgi:hypothetical protein
MAHIKITQAQAEALYDARTSYNKKNIKRQIFAEIRKEHGIPKTTKISAVILDNGPDYLKLRAGKGGRFLDNGLPDAPVVAPVSSPVATPETPLAKTLPVETVQVKKPAAKTLAKPAAKTPAKTLAKPAAKTLAEKSKPTKSLPTKQVKSAEKPAKATKASIPGHSLTKTPTHDIEIRATVNGVRTRLGWASSEKAKERVIAAAKAA